MDSILLSGCQVVTYKRSSMPCLGWDSYSMDSGVLSAEKFCRKHRSLDREMEIGGKAKQFKGNRDTGASGRFWSRAFGIRIALNNQTEILHQILLILVVVISSIWRRK